MLLQAVRAHRFPGFEAHHPQLDQRNSRVDFARNETSSYPLWARVSPTASGRPIELPLVGWQGFLDKTIATSEALVPGQAQRREDKQLRQASIAGRAPILTVRDGYRPKLDPNQNKIACEPGE